MSSKRYPLLWPVGWKRSAVWERKDSRFTKQERTASVGNWRRRNDLSIADAVKRLAHTLQKMNINEDNWLISSNLLLRLDGLPRSNQTEPSDTGAAVYWADDSVNRVLAIDIYNSVADNIAALAKTLEALRDIERHGGGAVLERAYTGFDALPPPCTNSLWWEVLGVLKGSTIATVEKA